MSLQSTREYGVWTSSIIRSADPGISAGSRRAREKVCELQGSLLAVTWPWKMSLFPVTPVSPEGLLAVPSSLP